MATATRSHTVDPTLMASGMFAQVFQAYLECSEECQLVVRDMVAVYNADDATDDDREMALSTISEALFPDRHDGHLGIDLEVADRLEKRESADSRAAMAEFDRQEQYFSDRVQTTLKERGMTQADLAKACGIGQPAISNLLNRQGRPQRRTVEKIAKALGVQPADLWPDAEVRV